MKSVVKIAPIVSLVGLLGLPALESQTTPMSADFIRGSVQFQGGPGAMQ
ncbi:MAG: hypothetical protein HOI95_30235 [Chromatiales bacterium]|nr:hypothetical protein [Chromatiales bacterium]